MVPSLLYIRADSLLTFRMTEQFCAEPGSRLQRDRPSRARERLNDKKHSLPSLIRKMFDFACARHSLQALSALAYS